MEHYKPKQRHCTHMDTYESYEINYTKNNKR
jgi:hypothetical protein